MAVYPGWCDRHAVKPLYQGLARRSSLKRATNHADRDLGVRCAQCVRNKRGARSLLASSPERSKMIIGDQAV